MNGLTTELRIVPMERAHLRDVRRIDELVYPKPWSLSLFRQELAMTDTRVYLVASLGDQQVGHAGMMLIAGEAHVTTVAVDPLWQGKGVASRLMIALHRAATVSGLRSMTLEVRVGNQRAIDLYRRFGYAPAGVRRNYYSEEGEDAIVMWVNDIHQPAHAERLAGIERSFASHQPVQGGAVADV